MSRTYLARTAQDGWLFGGRGHDAQPLGPEVNSTEYGEFAPTMSPDGRTLYFSRNDVHSFEPKLDIAWENIFYVPVSRIPALQSPGGS